MSKNTEIWHLSKNNVKDRTNFIFASI